MKEILILIIGITYFNFGFTQTPVSQIEGFLEVYHHEDTTSTYVGKNVGNLLDESLPKGNSFFGTNAGRFNISGFSNTFFGANAGYTNSFAFRNSFFGASAGYSNTVGNSNSFFGHFSGNANTSGSGNSLFGLFSGLSNTIGSGNSFFGLAAGRENTIGGDNSFIGYAAGRENTTGRFNTILGASADFEGGNKFRLNYATAIGAHAKVSTDNTLVIGRPVDAAVIPGRLIVGQPIPTIPDGEGTAVHINAGEDGDAELIIESDTDNTGSEADNPRISLRQDDATISGFVAMEGDPGTTSTGTIGNSMLFGSEKPNVPLHIITNDISRITIHADDHIAINELGPAGSTQVCRNGLLELSTCSSSIRYKKEVTNYKSGMKVINQLRPVSYQWKHDNLADIGFIAEEVAKIDERLITRNDEGEIEGVKYDRLTAVLVNVNNEQQTLINELMNDIHLLQFERKKSKEMNDQLKKENKDILSMLEVLEQRLLELEKRSRTTDR